MAQIDPALLTEEQRKELKYWAEFFESHGFKTLADEATKLDTGYTESLRLRAKSDYELGFCQGAVSVLDWLINQPKYRELALVAQYGVLETAPEEDSTDPLDLA